MDNVPVKIAGNQLTAVEYNNAPQELKNAVETSGQVLGGDWFQVSRAMAIYAATGDYYTDSGAANAYVLNLVSTRKGTITYEPGMRVRFMPGNTNTAASTINVNSLGVKNIKDESASDLSPGELTAGDLTELYYNGTDFILSGYINEIEIKELIQEGNTIYGITAGGTTAYTLTLTPTPTGIPRTIKIKMNATNTGASTINVNGLGIKSLVKGVSNTLVAGDLIINQIYTFIYDGTNYILNASDFQPGIAKAWVTFDGNGGSVIKHSKNITSVSRTSTGIYVVTFSVTFSDAFWGTTVSAEAPLVSAPDGRTSIYYSNKTTTAVTVECVDGGGILRDSDLITVVAFGVLA